ncbi:hypothetical protein NMY22_g14393 [Coprinellus aureogranulatus]|nr:hypothetical protein NMY22_g14393 [Coprinellus aureogranulatus]
MRPPTPPASSTSLKSYIRRFKAFTTFLKSLKWMEKGRCTVDYYPGTAAHTARHLKHRPMIVWHARDYYGGSSQAYFDDSSFESDDSMQFAQQPHPGQASQLNLLDEFSSPDRSRDEYEDEDGYREMSPLPVRFVDQPRRSSAGQVDLTREFSEARPRRRRSAAPRYPGGYVPYSDLPNTLAGGKAAWGASDMGYNGGITLLSPTFVRSAQRYRGGDFIIASPRGAKRWLLCVQAEEEQEVEVISSYLLRSVVCCALPRGVHSCSSSSVLFLTGILPSTSWHSSAIPREFHVGCADTDLLRCHRILASQSKPRKAGKVSHWRSPSSGNLRFHTGRLKCECVGWFAWWSSPAVFDRCVLLDVFVPVPETEVPHAMGLKRNISQWRREFAH